MQVFKSILTALILTTFAGVQAEENYSTLLEEAIEAIYWEYEDDWAFTESSLSEDRLRVGHYDPRLNDDEQWSLISVDGRDPTETEAKEYSRDKEKHGSASDSRTTKIVEPDSLELIEETDDYWLFTFVPDDDEDVFTENVDAKVKIVKAGHYLESIDIRNHADINPGFGTKLTSFLMQFTFGPAIDGGPIVPKDIKVRVVGRALLFIPINEAEATRYNDFEYAGGQE